LTLFAIKLATELLSVLPKLPDHHSKNLKLAFRVDDRIGLVLRLQHDPAAFTVQALQGELVIHNRDDNVTDIRALYIYLGLLTCSPTQSGHMRPICCGNDSRKLALGRTQREERAD